MQYRLDLSGSAKNALHDVPEKTHTGAERQSAEEAQRENKRRLTFAFALWRRRG